MKTQVEGPNPHAANLPSVKLWDFYCEVWVCSIRDVRCVRCGAAVHAEWESLWLGTQG